MTEYALSGHQLESPLINAAGSVSGGNHERILQEVEQLACTGIGAITVGSFTVLPREGNEAVYGSPTYYYDSAAGKTYNSIGLENIGAEAAVALAPKIIELAHDAGKPVIYSCSPAVEPEAGDSVEQARRLAAKFLAAGVDMVELNVSCPNVVTDGGGRKPILGYDLESMARLVDVLAVEVGDGNDLGLKLPPYQSDAEKLLIPDITKLLKARKVFSFIVTANIVPGQIPRHEDGSPILSVPGGAGGMSGPATKGIGREQLRLWHENIGGSLDIVSALGVDSGAEVHARLQLGAAAASGVTFLWESPNWASKVTNMLLEYTRAV